MPTLDIRTLITVFIASNLLVGLLMLVTFKSRFSPPLKTWTISLFMQALGWSLISRCDLTMNVIGFVVVSFSYCVMLHALLMYFGLRCRYAFAYWPFSLTVLLILFLPETPWQRQFLAQLISSIQVTLVGGIFFVREGGGSHILRRLIGISGLTGAFMLFWRAMHLLQVQQASCISEVSDPTQGNMFLLFVIVRLAFLFGFLLLIESKQLEAITRLATLDPLTETYNRRSFHELAEQEIQRARRSDSPLSLIAIDLDFFKRINDTKGHQAGDSMLKHVRDVVRNCLRSHDLFARHGGEEFMVLAPMTDTPGAMTLAERLRSAIETSESAHGLKITASLGVCSWDQVAAHHTLDQLINAADTALYEAKDAGRNCVKVAQAT